MKVLLQNPVASNEISGVVTFVRNTQELLVRSGVEVRILVTATASLAEIREGVEWADIVHLNANHGATFLWAKLLHKPVVLHYHYPIWGTWKQTTTDRELGFLGCWRKSLEVYWNHGEGWRHTVKFWNYFLSHLGRSILRVILCWLADARITCSEFLRNDTKIPWPVSVVPNGFNFDDLTRWRDRPFPMSADFCFMGRVTPQKDLSCLLKAAALLKAENIPMHIHVIGDGNDLETCKERARELGIDGDVTFHGRLDWDAALTVLSECAVLVIPSDYDEAAGYVVTEAYALKRAVIGSHRGGIPEQIGPGLIFQATDYRGLADKMALFARDLSYARKLGEEGYRFALKRTGHVDGLLEIYRKLTS